MFRLVTLGMLAAIVGGGYTLLSGNLRPQDVAGVVNVAGQVLQQGGPYPSQQQGGYAGPPQQSYGGYGNQGYGIPGFGSPAPPSGPMASGPGQMGPGYGSSQPTVPAPLNPNSVIRIASFNIQVFGDSKAGKPYVMNELSRIVQQFDIVAIQEIRTQDDYFIDNFLRQYVNAGGKRYSRVVGPRLGRSRSTEQYAFLFNTDTVMLEQRLVYTVTDSPEDLLHREPLVAMFYAKGAASQSDAFSFILVNTHTDPDETDTELDALALVYDAVRRQGPGEDDVIILGDLNTNVPIEAAPSQVAFGPFGGGQSARQLVPRDLRGLGSIAGIYPVIRTQPTNVVGTKLHDNILVHRGATTEFTGTAGVYNIGALHGLRLDQVKQVSDHLPVWAEFSVYEGGVPGRMAAARRNSGR